jgi:GNAT superfamily N-acetyltransferase
MQLEEHADATAFLEAAAPVLAADEARHNLIYGICSTLIDVPDAYPDAQLWTVTDGDVVGAAAMTPPFNIVVAKPVDDDALRFLARELSTRSLDLPGVVGAIPEVEVFAEAWSADRRLRMRQGIYAAHSVTVPTGVSGEPRPAGEDDHELLVDWLRAFQEEALPEEAGHLDLDQAVERRLQRAGAGFGLWVDGSEPVSVCGFGGLTPHGKRIGPVYTPPDLRGRGYGSAVTAHVTKEQLDADRDYCFLYTDLSNPTSNKIYVNIGYEFVCDSAEYAFLPSES